MVPGALATRRKSLQDKASRGLSASFAIRCSAPRGAAAGLSAGILDAPRARDAAYSAPLAALKPLTPITPGRSRGDAPPQSRARVHRAAPRGPCRSTTGSCQTASSSSLARELEDDALCTCSRSTRAWSREHSSRPEWECDARTAGELRARATQLMAQAASEDDPKTAVVFCDLALSFEQLAK
jgi:hypothetical protein